MAHIPERTCILCRGKFEKSQLLRIVKHNDVFFIDETHKKDGRGAYICAECKTSENLLKKRALDRAFRVRVPDEIYDLLKGE